MSYNAHDAYLESRILSAEPLELVRLMCQACVRSVRDARAHLASGEVRARSQSLTKAAEILIELAASLDYERGGVLSVRLGGLYEYMLGRLTEAHVQQADAPMAEVLGLLTTLSEAWDGVALTAEPAPAEARWPQALPTEGGPVCESQSWSA
jgi:flagellar protein FliS